MKKTLGKYLSVWLTTSKLTIQQALENRMGALLFLIGKLIRFFMFLGFMLLLTERVGSIGGFDQREMIVFFLVFNIFDIAGQTFFRGIYWFREQVVSGEFDFRLVKPMNALFQALTRQTEVLDLPVLLIVIIFLVYYTHGISILNVIMFGLLMLVAMVVITAIHIMVASLGVVTTEVDHTIMIYRDLSSMARFPVDIYAPNLRTLLTFVIPIALAFTVPAKALLGMLNWNHVFLVLVSSIGFLLFSLWIWNLAVKSYSSASS